MDTPKTVYHQSRLKAAAFNDKLKSREGAAELLGCSVSTLSNYELAVTKIVPPDAVVMMADLYNAPELKNHYCATECPIGCGRVAPLELSELEKLTLKILVSLKNVGYVQETLIEIAADGIISGDEMGEFKKVISMLDSISKSAQALKLWAEKKAGK